MSTAHARPPSDALRLAWAFAEVLAGDAARAEALLRAAVQDAGLRRDERSSRPHRLLAAVRERFYRAGAEAGGARAPARSGEGETTRLESAVAGLPDEDRELLFLRYGAGLPLVDIGRISGRPPASARARIAELCARLAEADRRDEAAGERPPATIH